MWVGNGKLGQGPASDARLSDGHPPGGKQGSRLVMGGLEGLVAANASVLYSKNELLGTTVNSFFRIVCCSEECIKYW